MNSSSTWLGLACNLSRSEARIGSTRPMPMKETTHANATAHTARGWLRIADSGAAGWAAGRSEEGGRVTECLFLSAPVERA